MRSPTVKDLLAEGKTTELYKAIKEGEYFGSQTFNQSLKRLYTQTEGWNALIELLRQDLERTPTDDKPARLRVLREIASVYRDRIKSDTALVTVLTQIVQLDNEDVDSLRELVRVYEALGRFRDLLQHQSSLAGLLPKGQEKTDLYRSVARRWMAASQARSTCSWLLALGVGRWGSTMSRASSR